MDAQRALAARYASDSPSRAARRLDAVAPDELAECLCDLPLDAAIRVIEHLVPSAVAAAFEIMPTQPLASLLAGVSVSRCVLVLRSVDPSERGRMVRLLPSSAATAVERLLRARDETVGTLAEPVPDVLLADMAIAEAAPVMSRITRPYAYVVDTNHRLVGVIRRSVVTAGDDRARVEHLMTADVACLPSAAPLAPTQTHPAWMRHDALPIVDGAGVLVGVLRHKRLRRWVAQAHAPSAGRGPWLGSFLDLGELYWVGLASVMLATTRRTEPDGSTEVEHV